MPYVPSMKTVPPADDRNVIDVAVERAARDAAEKITHNSSLTGVYATFFEEVALRISAFPNKSSVESHSSATTLAHAILDVSQKYEYDGAHLGEFNYAMTRFIQRVPQIKVENGQWKQELRYWLYARTVAALSEVSMSLLSEERDALVDLGGVLVDIKDEYARRVKPAYEAEQIMKSGDCYDASFYTRHVEVVDSSGEHVGHMEVMLKRSPETLYVDRLPGKLVLQLQ